MFGRSFLLSISGFGSCHAYDVTILAPEHSVFDFFDTLRWLRNFLNAEKYLLREIFVTYMNVPLTGHAKQKEGPPALLLTQERLAEARRRCAWERTDRCFSGLLEDHMCPTLVRRRSLGA